MFPSLILAYLSNQAKNGLKEHGENNGFNVKWEADEEEEDSKQSSLDSFMVVKKEKRGRKRENLDDLRRKKTRFGIFNELGLSKVTKFVEAAY